MSDHRDFWELHNQAAFPMDYSTTAQHATPGMSIHQYATIQFAAALLTNPAMRDAPPHVISGYAIEQADDLFRVPKQPKEPQ